MPLLSLDSLDNRWTARLSPAMQHCNSLSQSMVQERSPSCIKNISLICSKARTLPVSETSNDIVHRWCTRLILVQDPRFTRVSQAPPMRQANARFLLLSHVANPCTNLHHPSYICSKHYLTWLLAFFKSQQLFLIVIADDQGIRSCSPLHLGASNPILSHINHHSMEARSTSLTRLVARPQPMQAYPPISWLLQGFPNPKSSTLLHRREINTPKLRHSLSTTSTARPYIRTMCARTC